jgi:hypothetical protein
MSLLIIPFFWQQDRRAARLPAAIARSGHPHTPRVFSLVLGSDMTVFWIVMMSISSLTSMVAQPQILASTAAGQERDGQPHRLRRRDDPQAADDHPLGADRRHGDRAVRLLQDFDADHTYGRWPPTCCPPAASG